MTAIVSAPASASKRLEATTVEVGIDRGPPAEAFAFARTRTRSKRPSRDSRSLDPAGKSAQVWTRTRRVVSTTSRGGEMVRFASNAQEIVGVLLCMDARV